MRTLIAVAAVCLLAPAARAGPGGWELTQDQRPNMHYGQLALHPYYRLAETYDSNIYLLPQGAVLGQPGAGVKSSWITTDDLGLEAALPWRSVNSLSLGYDVQSQLYTAQPSVNDTINQDAHADYVRAGARAMTYRAGDRYVNTTDQAFSELIQRQRRWMNRVYAAADYAPKGGRLAAGVDVDQETDKYLDAAAARQLNRYQQDAGFSVGYAVQPKTRAYAAYRRGVIHYSVDPSDGTPGKDSKSHTVVGGVLGDLTAKLTGRVEGGMTFRKYDAVPVSGGSRFENAFVLTTNVAYKASPYTTAVLGLTRALQESIDPSNPFYYANDAFLTVERAFPPKVRAGIRVEFGRNQYENAQTVGAATGTRRDDLYQGGAWVQYDVRSWLSTGLAYLRRERDSNFASAFNYQDDQTTWNATLRF